MKLHPGLRYGVVGASSMASDPIHPSILASSAIPPRPVYSNICLLLAWLSANPVNPAPRSGANGGVVTHQARFTGSPSASVAMPSTALYVDAFTAPINRPMGYSSQHSISHLFHFLLRHPVVPFLRLWVVLLDSSQLLLFLFPSSGVLQQSLQNCDV